MANDVWVNLSRNWIDFFWLTGETPTTLGALVNDLENEFIPHRPPGRNCALNHRNQVMWGQEKSHQTILSCHMHSKTAYDFLFSRFYLRSFGCVITQLCNIWQWFLVYLFLQHTDTYTNGWECCMHISYQDILLGIIIITGKHFQDHTLNGQM